MLYIIRFYLIPEPNRGLCQHTLVSGRRIYMQIVYLSNRPDILRDTLSSVARFMAFIDEVVIVIPGNMQSGFDYVNDLFPAGFIHDYYIKFQEIHRGALLPLL